MMSDYMFEKVRKLKAEGLSRAKIAEKLGLNTKTVSKYLKLNTPPKYKIREKPTRSDPLKGYEDKIKQWLDRTPTLTDREIYELLIPEGYRGSERTINRKVISLKSIKPKERFFEQEYEPAEQCQFDFKEKVELPFVDGTRIVYLHFGTLPFSDTCIVKGYSFKNYACFMDGVHSFFESIGGMTESIRFDNLSPVVKEILPDNKRIYTDHFNRATAYYDFGLLPCSPGKGNEKGDVERDIRSYAIRIKNRVSHETLIFRDWEHLNEWLIQFMKERETQETKLLREEEQKKFQVLPSRDEAILCDVITTSGSSYGGIRIGKSVYSVPDAWIEKECRAVGGPYDVKIRLIKPYHKDNTIVIHPRKPDGEHSILLAHVLPSLVRKPHAMVRWAHREILFPSNTCQRFYDLLKKQEGHSAERDYLRSINLIQYVPFSEIVTGMELVLEANSEQLFNDLRDLLLHERRPADVIDINSWFNQNPLQPNLSEYDRFIPKENKANEP